MKWEKMIHLYKEALSRKDLALDEESKKLNDEILEFKEKLELELFRSMTSFKPKKNK